jgi:VanZ family protein
MRGLKWLPPLLWTLVIASSSSSSWGPAETSHVVVPILGWLWAGARPEQLEALHWLVRKVAHVVEYGVLGLLWYGALAPRGNPARWRIALALGISTAALDELHQATTLTRTGSAADVAIDTAAVGAVLIGLTGAQPTLRWITTGLLWLAAAGGTILLAFDWAADAPAGWLWGSVSASWIALLVWHVGRRRRRA